MLVGVVWSAVWLTTFSWPALFAAIWMVVALTNPRRQLLFPGVVWVRYARDLWRGTRCDKMGVVGRTRPRLSTTQRSQA